jgi:DNA repair exonuclease SbcCD ATPase subunit
MTKDKTYDPFEGFKQLSEICEKQVNGLLYMLTDNKEFVRTANMGIEAHSRYMELLRKNQEILAGFLNIPTKKDVANAAKLAVQAEGKIDTLEEQIWALQDHSSASNNENFKIFQEMVSIVKQIKAEFHKTEQELAETKRLVKDLHEIREAIVEIRLMQVNLQELRKEVEEMKELQAKVDEADATGSQLLQLEVQGIKQGISQLSDIKKEISSLKTLVKKEKEKDIALTGAGTSK